MRIWASTLIVMVMTCVAAPGRSDECGDLRPGPGPFEGIDIDYESAVHRLLLTPEKHEPDVQMVRLSAGEPTEDAVYIIDKHEHSLPPRKPDYELVSVRAQSSILEAISKNGPMAMVPVDIRRVPIDPNLVEELRKIWQQMIRRAAFPSSLDIEGLDTEYYFTAKLDVGPGSAYVMGPPRGTCPAAFAELGELLFDYANVDAKQRSALREKLLRQAKELRARLSQVRTGR